MNVKKVKRKCEVRGCKKITAYNISHMREMGNSIIICMDCAKEAVKSIANFEKTGGI